MNFHAVARRTGIRVRRSCADDGQVPGTADPDDCLALLVLMNAPEVTQRWYRLDGLASQTLPRGFRLFAVRLQGPDDTLAHEVQQLLAAVHGNQEAMDNWVRVFAGVVSPAEFFAEENVRHILARGDEDVAFGRGESQVVQVIDDVCTSSPGHGVHLAA